MAAGLLCNKDASISVYALQLRAVVCPKPSFAPSAWKNKIKSIGTLSVLRNSGKKRFQTLILRAEQEKNANPPTTSNSTKNHEKNPTHDSSTDSKPKPINTNGSRKPDQRWNNKKWKWREILGMQFREVVGLFMQVGVVFFLMRLLRPRMPFGGEVRVPTSFSSVPYSQFLSRVKKNEVLKVEMDDDHFTFQLKPEVEASSGGAGAGGDSVDVAKVKRVLYTTTKPSGVSLPYDEMLENQVEFGAPEKRSGGFFNSAMVALLYIALFAGLIQRLPFRFQFSSGRLGSPKTRSSGSSKTLEQGENVTFADVAGVDEAKEELEEIVEFLRNPDRYTRVGARPPRGVLLVGLPGTGKTLLAKAVAGEAEVPFISCSASEFVELYVGMGASRVRELFAKAKKDAPSIIFIDEIDAVAKSRDGRIRVVSNDEREQTLNQLLTEMDGFDSSSAVIVLGATNRADVLDPALRRPGRFDRIVTVEAPDRTGREAILKVHASKRQLPLSSDVDLKAIATATTGFTGADLAKIVNEAALLAGRANKQVVSKEDFIQAVERSIAGIEKKRSTLQRSEKGVVARHEVGHAICGTAVANLLPGQSQVAKLSILPRSGGALGFTYTPPSNEDRYLLFIDELRGRLVTLLGGRAAEEVAYSGRVSTGALDDIKRATDMAYKAIAEYGLNQSIGPVSIATLSSGGLDDSGGAAPWTRDQGQVLDLVQKEVKDLLQSALEVALAVVRSNPTVLEGLGSELEANEKMDGELLRDWLKLVISPIELDSFIKGEYKKKIEDSIDVEVATPASAETIK